MIILHAIVELFGRRGESRYVIKTILIKVNLNFPVSVPLIPPAHLFVSRKTKDLVAMTRIILSLLHPIAGEKVLCFLKLLKVIFVLLNMKNVFLTCYKICKKHIYISEDNIILGSNFRKELQVNM